MKTPEIRGPPLAKVPGNGTFDLPHQPGTGDSHLTSCPHKPGKIIQVQVVRPIVRVGIEANDGVEEFRAERQRAGVGMDRKNAIFHTGIADPLDVLRRAEP